MTDWTATGYNFLFQAGTADTTGAYMEGGWTKRLWGPNDGAANGLPASSPTGGNFIAADGDYDPEPIYQTINDLNIGQTYALSFYWAAVQQYGFNGATTENWKVSFGEDMQSTPVASISNHGFSGWMYETMTFTAANNSEVLAFLAAGTPQGEPPFVLLDGVSLTAVTPDQGGSSQSVPEPAPWTILGGSLLLVLAAHGCRQRKPSAPSLSA